MYALHFRRYFDVPSDYVVQGDNFSTVAEARESRVASGDLVINQETGKIETNDLAWLFDWERDDPNCYARRAIAWQVAHP